MQKRYCGGVDAQRYVRRLCEDRVSALFGELPALLITGPRATGKTTTARRHARSVVRLDVAAEARAFQDDPDAALRTLPTPVLLDEWQAVPGVLGAVKRAVDEDPRAGRFLLTGSVSARLDAQSWPATGRVVPLRMYGLTMREMTGSISGPPFLERLASANIDALAPPRDAPDLLGYVELALRGGFPEAALRLSTDARNTWLEGYLDQLFTRDVAGLDETRDPERLRRYFEALALNTAGTATGKTLHDAAGLDRRTALAYERLLVNLFVLDIVPAWSSNRLSRLTRAGKRYLVDPSLAAAALRLTETAVMRDGDMLGRIIDTFTLAQLRPELELRPLKPRLHHLRTRDGRHEIDVIAELSAGEIVAIEVKSTAAPTRQDARHLEWLRDQLGERFCAGAVLHTGPRPFRLAERILAVPIASLWG